MANLRFNSLEEEVQHPYEVLGDWGEQKVRAANEDTLNHGPSYGESCANPVTVDVTTPDSALEHELPTLMKMDVEGFGKSETLGGEKTLFNSSRHSVMIKVKASCGRYGIDESSIVEMIF